MTNEYPDIASVILCGGQSRRMGTDKGLLTFQGATWVTILQQALSLLSLPVYVSIRANQQAAYRRVVAAGQLLVDQPWEDVAGPLVGVLSAAQALPNRHLLIVPCDMPLLSRPVFELWLEAFLAHAPTYQAFISQVTGRWQPLCGVYHRRGLDTLADYYQQGRLQALSMQTILEDILSTYPVLIPPSLAQQFANYNFPDDIAGSDSSTKNK